jgi:hypothetical protein
MPHFSSPQTKEENHESSRTAFFLRSNMAKILVLGKITGCPGMSDTCFLPGISRLFAGGAIKVLSLNE